MSSAMFCHNLQTFRVVTTLTCWVTAYVYHIRLHGLNLQYVWSASALVVGHLLVLVLVLPATCCMWLDFQIEWANCLLSSNDLHLRFISVICAPRAHDKSEVGSTCPSVPHDVGAYAPFSANPSHRSLSFPSSGFISWIPQTVYCYFQAYSVFYVLVFLFLHFLVVGSVR